MLKTFEWTFLAYLNFNVLIKDICVKLMSEHGFLQFL